MVSAAKYSRAERDLKAARPYGEGAQSFYSCAGNYYREFYFKWKLLNWIVKRFYVKHVHNQTILKFLEVGAGEEEKKDTPKEELYVALTSDRGLCGAVHSSICKSIRNELLEKPSLENVGIICVGDKSRAQLGR